MANGDNDPIGGHTNLDDIRKLHMGAVYEPPRPSLEAMEEELAKAIRKFETGAIRDGEGNKADIEGIFCPLVMRAYSKYLFSKIHMPDGSIRSMENWQKGIPIESYMKSKCRHDLDLKLLFRGYKAYDELGKEVSLKEALCAIMFNTMGYLHEVLKKEEAAK
jgi:hypothetical protein